MLGARPEDFVPWRFGDRHPLDPNVWADERQYAQSDPREALAAFQRRRAEVLALLRGLSDAQWAASLAGHDDNHLAQLAHALDGRP